MGHMMDNVFLVLLLLFGTAGSHATEQQLIRNLMVEYDPDVRPVQSLSEPIAVSMDVSLHQIIELNAKKQTFTASLWQRMFWTDENLRWNSTDYGGLDKIRLSPDRVWRPDIALVNEVETESNDQLLTYPIIVSSRGDVTWLSPRLVHVACSLDMTHFPWDSQKCILQFSSWTHDNKDMVLTNRSAVIESSSMIEDGEWDLVKLPVTKFTQKAPCCENPYIFLDFEVHLRRKIRYYITNLIFPATLITASGLLVFCLPTESGEKVSLSVTILLATTVFQLVLADSMPVQSLAIPIITRYIMCTQILLGLSTVLTILVINICHKGSIGLSVPPGVRKVVRTLAYVLCLRKKAAEVLNDKISLTQKLSPIDEYIKIRSNNQSELNTDDLNENKAENLSGIVRRLAQTAARLDSALTDKERDDQGHLEWLFVSIVLDRLFFLLFAVAICVSSLVLLLGSGHYRGL